MQTFAKIVRKLSCKVSWCIRPATLPRSLACMYILCYAKALFDYIGVYTIWFSGTGEGGVVLSTGLIKAPLPRPMGNMTMV